MTKVEGKEKARHMGGLRRLQQVLSGTVPITLHARMSMDLMSSGQHAPSSLTTAPVALQRAMVIPASGFPDQSKCWPKETSLHRSGDMS